MRQKIWKSGLGVWLIACLIVASGCSSGGANSQKNDSAQDTNAASAQDTNAGAEPLGKYDPAITLTTVRSTDSSVKFKEGESYENNAWYNSYLNDLGIKLNYKWIVNADQYESKLNVSISSGDLPDFFDVDANQLKQLVAAGKIEDLTPYYDKYASDLTRKMIESGANAKQSAIFDGKLMALPPAEDYVSPIGMLWVRTDWLKKLNLPEPKTLNDVLTISKAFTTQDPDGNHKDDTYGLAAFKDLWGSGYADLDGFMNAYHAYPSIWIKDASGKLVYGSIQPEMKTALAQLQQMYKDGEIDKEFGVKDNGKESELMVAGKIGMNYGQQWDPLWPIQLNKDQDANAEWAPFPIVSADDQPALPQTSVSFNSFIVVRKGAPHPEAVIKLQNLAADHWFGDSADTAKYHDSDGIEFFKYMAFMQGTPLLSNIDHHLAVVDALKSGDASKLNSEQQGYYDKIVDFQKTGTGAGWGYNLVFGENGSQELLRKYNDGELPYMKNEFFGAPTPTMLSKKSTLDKLELETFTRIILGDSLDGFDQFVSNWKKLGGDQITQEVNDWYANLK